MNLNVLNKINEEVGQCQQGIKECANLGKYEGAGSSLTTKHTERGNVNTPGTCDKTQRDYILLPGRIPSLLGHSNGSRR